MTESSGGIPLAKILWTDPTTGHTQEHVLIEGATATIGRSSNNDICIPEQHVSRQHAVISYRDGVFMISDLGSANGTFVNEERLHEAYPLASGDRIRLYVPVLAFSAAVTEADQRLAEEQGNLITPGMPNGNGFLIITSGPQEGHKIPLLLDEITIGRATSKGQWEIGLQDPSVSRPHARLQRVEDAWSIIDLGSANGTFVNNTRVTEKGHGLQDGDTLRIGTTHALFRTN
jgi:pSer/pThr/pTyr-binding forkhead associated (FHA) protein